MFALIPIALTVLYLTAKCIFCGIVCCKQCRARGSPSDHEPDPLSLRLLNQNGVRSDGNIQNDDAHSINGDELDSVGSKQPQSPSPSMTAIVARSVLWLFAVELSERDDIAYFIGMDGVERAIGRSTGFWTFDR